MEKKIEFLIAVFLDILYQVTLYYEYHFGIMGIDETMLMDQIVMM